MTTYQLENPMTGKPVQHGYYLVLLFGEPQVMYWDGLRWENVENKFWDSVDAWTHLPLVRVEI